MEQKTDIRRCKTYRISRMPCDHVLRTGARREDVGLRDAAEYLSFAITDAVQPLSSKGETQHLNHQPQS